MQSLYSWIAMAIMVSFSANVNAIPVSYANDHNTNTTLNTYGPHPFARSTPAPLCNPNTRGWGGVEPEWLSTGINYLNGAGNNGACDLAAKTGLAVSCATGVKIWMQNNNNFLVKVDCGTVTSYVTAIAGCPLIKGKVQGQVFDKYWDVHIEADQCGSSYKTSW
ncbi:uncharacterized protein LY89DRAFT_754352 [Mollisia scopiformis]|uniref:Uncharacterized protein n=1 Tax=Mollisia scopiformis TaxID=149040 RepID=A0A194X011_MOLSC|nr:uncharacterized protein LY89DRAFT_754352 [Mollisia scopiformis]KUJ13538.1 hypothetical protein LY89DRAFT_754352 [Mollisia scopiformis]